MAELIEKLNELFGADTTDQDQLVYVNHVIKGKLLESETLQQQAANNTKEQFANSPDLKTELLNAIMGALDAHTSMSTKALNSPTVQSGMKDILLNHSALWETLRAKATAPFVRLWTAYQAFRRHGRRNSQLGLSYPAYCLILPTATPFAPQWGPLGLKLTGHSRRQKPTRMAPANVRIIPKLRPPTGI